MGLGGQGLLPTQEGEQDRREASGGGEGVGSRQAGRGCSTPSKGTQSGHAGTPAVGQGPSGLETSAQREAARRLLTESRAQLGRRPERIWQAERRPGSVFPFFNSKREKRPRTPESIGFSAADTESECKRKQPEGQGRVRDATGRAREGAGHWAELQPS